ncbi:hypothetical protein [Desulfosporosinus hippei]|uniref:Uncharacterized protein n=1 Tax=Desulfosporosinus hippei DSM 8344 TaxID=1121419 RepID=A0A1G8H270_9FIRM|nr:hypothetical protein [Desulfosporosinus hippei]SDI00600.1 hypothetical protein SAMN05443529_12423 [Desulfosporosinus hippei DSM 8344]
MKTYNKPSIKYFELRVEESLAGVGSIPYIPENNRIIEMMLSDESWADFWLKILRK